jgi:GT2 family glycosyltransferase
MMIKRDNVPVIGLMDEQYPFYFEETDYCYNARDKGYKVVYTPDTTVVHYHQKSSKDKESARKWFDIGKKIFDAKWAHIMGDRKIYG